MENVREISFASLTKVEKYEYILQCLNELIDAKVGRNANLGNTMSLLKQVHNWWWVGIYKVKNNMLELDVFQGDPACTTIQIGKGVCGHTWLHRQTTIVPNVHEFPGHIACSSQSNSEIVVPIFNNSKEVLGVLDVDSKDFSCFDEVDRNYLEQICTKLAALV